MYPNLRNIHLLCGALALPALLMYALSAIQMAHTRWFPMAPTVSETATSLEPQLPGGRRVALEAMKALQLRGQIAAIDAQPSRITARIVVPGTVHELNYNPATGALHVRTTVASFMGMLNRLHHAAGFWPDYLPLRLWGVFVAVASLAILGLGTTGLWMWWLRRQDRKWGLALLAANLAFSATILLLLRFTR